MKSQKLTLSKTVAFNKIVKLSVILMFILAFFSGCVVLRDETYFATKGTLIASDNDEDAGGPPSDAKDHGNTQIGGGVEILIGPKLGEKTEVLGVLGYNRYYYFVGNDDLIKLGLQGRRTFGNDSFWFGAEASYVKDWAYLKDITDNPEVGMAGYIFNPVTQQLEYRRKRTATGWMSGILGGYRIKQIKSLDMSVFAGAYFMHLGDFKSTLDEITKDSHNNLHFKVGVELALPHSK